MASKGEQKASIPEKLAQIADVLQCSPEAFSDKKQATVEIAGAAEFLNIWHRLDDRDRQRLLEFARQIAAER